MEPRKPRVEEVVASLTARFAAAEEIRAHAARLVEVADAQKDEARAEAKRLLGDPGDRLFAAVLAAYDHSVEDGTRLSEIPGLAESLLPPWHLHAMPDEAETARAQEVAEVRTASVAVRTPAQQAVPSPPQPERAARVQAAHVPDHRPGPATTAAPVGPDDGFHGVEVPKANLASAGKIVAEAKAFVAAGDVSRYAEHGSKWVGLHAWRRDLFRAAFLAEARSVGMHVPGAGPPVAPEAAREPEAARVPEAPGIPGPSPAAAVPAGRHVRPPADPGDGTRGTGGHTAGTAPASHAPAAAEKLVAPVPVPFDHEGHGPEVAYGGEHADWDDPAQADGYDDTVPEDDVVLGADEEVRPLPVVPAAAAAAPVERMPQFLLDLEEEPPDDAGYGWPPARDGPDRAAGPGPKLAPGLI